MHYLINATTKQLVSRHRTRDAADKARDKYRRMIQCTYVDAYFNGEIREYATQAEFDKAQELAIMRGHWN